jgi:hypothetical protein
MCLCSYRPSFVSLFGIVKDGEGGGGISETPFHFNGGLKYEKKKKTVTVLPLKCSWISEAALLYLRVPKFRPVIFNFRISRFHGNIQRRETTE